MKNIILIALTLFSLKATAQAPTEADVLKMWNEVWQAYEANDAERMWSYYTDNTVEIYPDGSSATGLANIKAGFEQFSGMLEKKPTWQMSKPTITFIRPDVVLLVCEVTMDAKLKDGPQIGGKSTFAVVIHKQNGKWYIAFDSQTPIQTMPGN